MELNIESEKENKLLGRKEIEAKITFDAATPNRIQIKELVCGKLGANTDFTVLRNTKNEFGMKRITVTLHIYKDAESMKKMEPGYIITRDVPRAQRVKKVKAPKAAPPRKK
jgi:ribosomal protein S24E